MPSMRGRHGGNTPPEPCAHLLYCPPGWPSRGTSMPPPKTQPRAPPRTCRPARGRRGLGHVARHAHAPAHLRLQRLHALRRLAAKHGHDVVPARRAGQRTGWVGGPAGRPTPRGLGGPTMEREGRRSNNTLSSRRAGPLQVLGPILRCSAPPSLDAAPPPAATASTLAACSCLPACPPNAPLQAPAPSPLPAPHPPARPARRT